METPTLITCQLTKAHHEFLFKLLNRKDEYNEVSEEEDSIKKQLEEIASIPAFEFHNKYL